MNPFTYFKLKREARKRTKKALTMLMYSGAIRPADSAVCYAMTPKEFKKLMETDTEEA